jgi:hypothetical protein
MDAFPEGEKQWFMHIGYLAQNWAAVESELDGMARQLHVHYDGHLIVAEVPMAFIRKYKFIRKAFAAHPKLAEFSDRCQPLLEEAKRLAETRHWALHSGWVESDQKEALLRRYSKSDPLSFEDKRFSLDEIYQAAVDCGWLTMNLSFFGQVAFGLKSQEEVDELISGLINKITPTIPSGDPCS